MEGRNGEPLAPNKVRGILLRYRLLRFRGYKIVAGHNYDDMFGKHCCLIMAKGWRDKHVHVPYVDGGWQAYWRAEEPDPLRRNSRASKHWLTRSGLPELPKGTPKPQSSEHKRGYVIALFVMVGLLWLTIMLAIIADHNQQPTPKDCPAYNVNGHRSLPCR